VLQRDRRLLNLIEDFGCASSSQIKALFFPDVSLRRCQQRLKVLTDKGRLKRFRDAVSAEYIYYQGKRPSEVSHMIARVDAYIKLSQLYRLSAFVPEYAVGNVRADAYFEIWRNGNTVPYFLEVQLSNYFRQDKYEKAYNSGVWLEQWDEFPAVVVVSDNNFRYKQSAIKFIQLDQKSPLTGL